MPFTVEGNPFQFHSGLIKSCVIIYYAIITERSFNSILVWLKVTPYMRYTFQRFGFNSILVWLKAVAIKDGAVGYKGFNSILVWLKALRS